MAGGILELATVWAVTTQWPWELSEGMVIGNLKDSAKLSEKPPSRSYGSKEGT